MKMLKRTAMVVGSLLVVLAVVGLFLPSAAHVERERIIDAPASVIYAHYADLHRFNAWSPWAREDPDASYSYEGPARGRGQRMRWSGSIAGQGSQIITLAEPYRRIELALDFGPDETATSVFQLSPDPAGTRVVWSFDTDFGYDLFGRYLGLLLDRMVGDEYEQGLDNLAALVADLPRTDFADLDYQFTEVSSVLVAYVGRESTLDRDAIDAAVARAFEEIQDFIVGTGLRQVGPRMTLTTAWDETDGRYMFDAAIPIDAVPGLTDSSTDVRVGQSYAGPVLQVAYRGPSAGIGPTYEMAESLLAAYGLESTERSFEEHRSDPDETRASEQLTILYFPLD
jgi:polyketide cyclase/dehydrase/lipid transport protein